jgi:hypothetical protein
MFSAVEDGASRWHCWQESLKMAQGIVKVLLV